MKKFALFLLVLSLIFSCGSCKETEKNIIKEDPFKQQIEEILSSMTLEEKIGQMLVVDWNSKVKEDDFFALLKEVKPGGFILMGHNVSSFEKTKNLISKIKETATIEIFISTDQEGGKVQRLKNLSHPKATYIPDMYSVGNRNDKAYAKGVGSVMGEELRALDIDITFAPVIDILSEKNNKVIGNRSFSSDSGVVTSMALSLAEGLTEKGVTPVFKHFPGHGDTVTDSHQSLPIINKSKEELEKEEFIPFKNAIEWGAEIIMIGHISLPKVTGDYTPSSMSKTIITDILKKELGYNGLIITDALNMKAVTQNYSEAEIYINAVNAGVDLLLMPQNPAVALKAIKENISEERINESVEKILAFKLKNTDRPIFDSSVLGTEEHRKTVQ